MNFAFAYVQFRLQETQDGCGKLHPGDQRQGHARCTHTHLSAYQLPQFPVCYELDPSIPGVKLSIQNQITLLPPHHNTSQVQPSKIHFYKQS